MQGVAGAGLVTRGCTLAKRGGVTAAWQAIGAQPET